MPLMHDMIARVPSRVLVLLVLLHAAHAAPTATASSTAGVQQVPELLLSTAGSQQHALRRLKQLQPIYYYAQRPAGNSDVGQLPVWPQVPPPASAAGGTPNKGPAPSWSNSGTPTTSSSATLQPGSTSSSNNNKKAPPPQPQPAAPKPNPAPAPAVSQPQAPPAGSKAAAPAAVPPQKPAPAAKATDTPAAAAPEPVPAPAPAPASPPVVAPPLQISRDRITTVAPTTTSPHTPGYCPDNKSLKVFAASSTRMCVVSSATATEGYVWNAIGQLVSYSQAQKCWVASCPEGVKPEVPGSNRGGIVTERSVQQQAASRVPAPPTIIAVDRAGRRLYDAPAGTTAAAMDAGAWSVVEQVGAPRRLLQDVFMVMHFAASCFSMCE